MSIQNRGSSSNTHFCFRFSWMNLTKIWIFSPILAKFILAFVFSEWVLPLRDSLIFNLVSAKWIRPDLTLLIKALVISERFCPKELSAIFWILYLGSKLSKKYYSHERINFLTLSFDRLVISIYSNIDKLNEEWPWWRRVLQIFIFFSRFK